MNHDEVINQPSKPQQLRHNEIVAIVKANPGISIGQITKAYYGEKSTGKYGGHMSAMLLELCYQNRIKYQEVNRYIAIEPTWTK